MLHSLGRMDVDARAAALSDLEPTAWKALKSGLGFAVLLMLVLGAVAGVVGEGELLSDGEAWLVFAPAWILGAGVSYSKSRTRFVQALAASQARPGSD
jgi:Na+-translocating ferredoxin:NAD+ oxidoreductase RnfE subunit